MGKLNVNDKKSFVLDVISEIKGLIVNIDGDPNKSFDSAEEVDTFIDEIERIIKHWVKIYDL